jgi:hypothetical protein
MRQYRILRSGGKIKGKGLFGDGRRLYRQNARRMGDDAGDVTKLLSVFQSIASTALYQQVVNSFPADFTPNAIDIWVRFQTMTDATMFQGWLDAGTIPTLDDVSAGAIPDTKPAVDPELSTNWTETNTFHHPKPKFPLVPVLLIGGLALFVIMRK